MDQETLDKRWDIHTERQLGAAKGGATAVTVLNSGSWLALLSQASGLEGFNVGPTVAYWGYGALLGTLLWLFIYFATRIQATHDYDRSDETKTMILNSNNFLGMLVAIGSLVCFGLGVHSLSEALTV